MISLETAGVFGAIVVIARVAERWFDHLDARRNGHLTHRERDEILKQTIWEVRYNKSRIDRIEQCVQDISQQLKSR